MDELLTRADRHAIDLHITMMLIAARLLRTREERIAYMTGQVFGGVHGGRRQVSADVAKYAADLIEQEHVSATAD